MIRLPPLRWWLAQVAPLVVFITVLTVACMELARVYHLPAAIGMLASCGASMAVGAREGRNIGQRWIDEERQRMKEPPI